MKKKDPIDEMQAIYWGWDKPTDAQVYELARQIYQKERTDYDSPDFNNASSDIARYCLNTAALRLGWKPSKDI